MACDEMLADRLREQLRDDAVLDLRPAGARDHVAGLPPKRA